MTGRVWVGGGAVQTLAREAGLTDLGSIARLVAECDVVLSVMNPGAAVDFAREAAAAIKTGGHEQRLVVDCARMRAALVAPGEWDVETGSNVTGRVDVIGPGSDRGWLALTPAYAYGDPHARDVRITAGAVSAADVTPRRPSRRRAAASA